jgi:hypothetical protein
MEGNPQWHLIAHAVRIEASAEASRVKIVHNQNALNAMSLTNLNILLNSDHLNIITAYAENLAQTCCLAQLIFMLDHVLQSKIVCPFSESQSSIGPNRKPQISKIPISTSSVRCNCWANEQATATIGINAPITHQCSPTRASSRLSLLFQQGIAHNFRSATSFYEFTCLFKMSKAIGELGGGENMA